MFFFLNYLILIEDSDIDYKIEPSTALHSNCQAHVHVNCNYFIAENMNG